jgi:hypothetical protein
VPGSTATSEPAPSERLRGRQRAGIATQFGARLQPQQRGDAADREPDRRRGLSSHVSVVAAKRFDNRVGGRGLIRDDRLQARYDQQGIEQHFPTPP